ncbi:two-component sensor histidine kinase [Winogradskyella echinorum]|uniref:histidine kinase n=1 Tax=Winogradskyella echinorum TaxID=538189 RepID=A0ABR6Y437_9FLAO|nr:ATP-binding protein [Winogradskyella echinorum]MBC3847439.1 two-component sensor histidine kinase [Winogradskyella echinorum]MBC5751787.1 two-component sensor histidine kinase [Winogradskyella echinorum]
MTIKNINWILYSIAVTIIITIAVQFYWNYKNYQSNKQRVTNEIQFSLDNALEEYYAEIAKTDFLTIINTDSDTAIWQNSLKDTIESQYTTINKKTTIKNDSILFSIKHELNEQLISENKEPIDSIIGYTQFSEPNKGFHLEYGKNISDVQVLKGKKAFDSLKVLQRKIGSILISIDRDTLEYSKIDSLIDIQFKQKDISARYSLMHLEGDSIVHQSNKKLDSQSALSVVSKSTYLKSNESIRLQFENPFNDAMRLSFSGIIISFLLSIAIISCLFYLLKIIKHQKQLAEVKNDLISNITHEFKTPIATIGVALESINSFNAIEDKEKTKKYIHMSSQQLGKLNVMVEKLLETATLDSDNLELNKEPIDVVALVNALVNRYKIQFREKVFNLSFKVESLEAYVDVFHFENALNNILDNAVKYGGNIISIDLIPKANMFNVLISDNGNSLTKGNKERIFEKFYRVPKGNTHDVKGFGIGLYYTKTIIDKHNGSIALDLNKNVTTFKITLPNGR